MEKTSEASQWSSVDNEETVDTDEFVDAADEAFDIDSDAYLVNPEMVNTDDESDSNMDDEKKDALVELAIMLNATLASEYGATNVARLTAHFHGDWHIQMGIKALELGFTDFEDLLNSKYMKDYVEKASVTNGVAFYRAVCLPSNEHILRRVADCKLAEEQIAEKRKMLRMMELKKPENAQNFIEGKRRILNILLDLKAYESAVEYQSIRDEYMKRYNTSLNATEHQRLFMNKSALKNFFRAFHREVILTNYSPIHVKLKSPEVKIPAEITEEDRRLVANVDNIELPTFVQEYHPPLPTVNRKTSLPEQSGGIIVRGGKILGRQGSKVEVKPTMDWGEEVVENEETNENEEPKRGGAFGVTNIEDINKTLQADASDHEMHGGRSKRANSDREIYTGDEESDDSSDEEVNVMRKSKKKRIKARKNTFNIPSLSPIQGMKAAVSSPNVISAKPGNAEKRQPVAERSLQRSISRSQPQHLDRLPSPLSDPRRRSFTEVNQVYTPSPSPPFNGRYRNSLHGSSTLEYNRVDHCDPATSDSTEEEEMNEHFLRPRLRRELNRIPFGSYHVPKPAPVQCSRHEELGEARSAQYFSVPAEQDPRSFRRPSENGFAHQLPSTSYHQRNGWEPAGKQARYQPNHFRQHDSDFPVVGHASRDISSVEYSEKWLSEGTQTDDNWIDEIYSELGYRNLNNMSDLQKLAEVVITVVVVRAPNVILLSELPKVVNSMYGRVVDLENDHRYRITWRALVANYCSDKVAIATLPNRVEVLYKK